MTEHVLIRSDPVLLCMCKLSLFHRYTVITTGFCTDMARGSTWSGEEVADFVEVWGNQAVMRHFNGNTKNTKAYELIAAMMVEKGYDRSVAQIRIKIKTLRAACYKAKDALSRSGADADAAAGCPHFEELDSFLGAKPLARPHHIARSTGG